MIRIVTCGCRLPPAIQQRRHRSSHRLRWRASRRSFRCVATAFTRQVSIATTVRSIPIRDPMPVAPIAACRTAAIMSWMPVKCATGRRIVHRIVVSLRLSHHRSLSRIAVTELFRRTSNATMAIPLQETGAPPIVMWKCSMQLQHLRTVRIPRCRYSSSSVWLDSVAAYSQDGDGCEVLRSSFSLIVHGRVSGDDSVFCTDIRDY